MKSLLRTTEGIIKPTIVNNMTSDYNTMYGYFTEVKPYQPYQDEPYQDEPYQDEWGHFVSTEDRYTDTYNTLKKLYKYKPQYKPQSKPQYKPQSKPQYYGESFNKMLVVHGVSLVSLLGIIYIAL